MHTMMLLTVLVVLLASMLVNRYRAVPVLALTWIVPAALSGAGDEATAQAIFLAPLVGLLGVYLRGIADRRLDPAVTARA